MSEEGLRAIVEQIGVLADRAEASRWEVAAAVWSAFEELPLYTRGLTSGLCLRLKKSTDQVYNLRDAESLRQSLRVEAEVSVSHMAALSRLRDRYDMTDDDCREWLEWIKETGASVREMSLEIATKHVEDARKAYFRRAARVGREVELLWQDAESVSMPEPVRLLTRAAVGALRAMLAGIEEWRAAD